jgi:hypothetical protein
VNIELGISILAGILIMICQFPSVLVVSVLDYSQRDAITLTELCKLPLVPDTPETDFRDIVYGYMVMFTNPYTIAISSSLGSWHFAYASVDLSTVQNLTEIRINIYRCQIYFVGSIHFTF